MAKKMSAGSATGKTSKATGDAKPKASKTKKTATKKAVEPKEKPVAQEVLVMTAYGAVNADGKMTALNGREVTFEGGAKYRLHAEELLVRPCPISEAKMGDQMVLVEAFGCGGAAIEIGEFGGTVSRNVVCFSSKRTNGFVERDVSDLSGTYLVIPVKPLGVDIKVVSSRGTVQADGEMLQLVDGAVEFANGARHSLQVGEMVVQACELAAVEEGQKVLLVEQWGCGGQFMQCGYLGRILSSDTICFKSQVNEDYKPTTIGRLAGGTYKVLN